jgi:hypothetical protein
LKKLRKRLLEAKSTDEVETLKEQMHIAEVDLNYTQYCPLSETYVSLYPQKSSAADGEDGGTAEPEPEPAPKPAMWAEVEKGMEEGSLDRLRNRVSMTRVLTAPRSLEMKPAKPKPTTQAAIVDTTGMNRRERRSQRTKDMFAGRTKNKSMAFERNQTFGAQAALENGGNGEDGGDSDGGFFEE